MVLGANGFPTQIQTFFTPELTTTSTKANDI